MINDDTLVVVKNRDNGSVSYVVDDEYRRLEAGEVKKIPFKELRTLAYKPGGQVLLKEYLIIDDKEVLENLDIEVEREYFYSKEKIRNILFNGSMDEFEDFLDFAPEGALELAKDIAVNEQIPDVRKRDLLGKKTGLNINNAIMVNSIMNEEDEKVEEAPKRRRVQDAGDAKSEASEKPVRRTSTPSYKVVE